MSAAQRAPSSPLLGGAGPPRNLLAWSLILLAATICAFAPAVTFAATTPLPIGINPATLSVQFVPRVRRSASGNADAAATSPFATTASAASISASTSGSTASGAGTATDALALRRRTSERRWAQFFRRGHAARTASVPNSDTDGIEDVIGEDGEEGVHGKADVAITITLNIPTASNTTDVNAATTQ